MKEMSNMYHSPHQVEPLDRDFSVQFDPNFLLHKTTETLAINDSPLVICRINEPSPQIEEVARVEKRGRNDLLEHAQTSSMITSSVTTSRGGKSRRKENNNKNNMRSGKPRSQAAHTMSERRRRENIRSKMKAMHQLLPNSDKTRNVEILDRAIEYIEELQRHIQIQEASLIRQNLQGNVATDDNSLQIGTKRDCLWPPGFQMVPPASSCWGSSVHHPSLLAPATTFPGELGPGIVPQSDHQVPIITPLGVPGCFWGMYGPTGLVVPQSDQSGSNNNGLNPSQWHQQVSGENMGSEFSSCLE